MKAIKMKYWKSCSLSNGSLILGVSDPTAGGLDPTPGSAILPDHPPVLTLFGSLRSLIQLHSRDSKLSVLFPSSQGTSIFDLRSSILEDL